MPTAGGGGGGRGELTCLHIHKIIASERASDLNGVVVTASANWRTEV